MHKFRTIISYQNHFEEFIKQQKPKIRNKIYWTLLLVEESQYVPEKYLKHIEGTRGLYEIRVQFSNDNFRIFCFFDEGNIVILANAFTKKSQKTPRQEISRALKIMEDYHEEKKYQQNTCSTY